MNESSSKFIWVSIGIIAAAVVLIAVGINQSKTGAPVDVLPIATIPTPDQPVATDPTQTLPTTTDSSTKKIMQTATIKTTLGEIVIKLDTENTPKTAENFITLAQKGFYSDTRFHRIMAKFMIQGGDPLSKKPYDAMNNQWGTGGPGYQFADEIKPTNNNARGTIAMANAGPNTNGSQFFINVVDNGYLNSKHTVFGTVIKGMDIADAISNSKADGEARPLTDIVIEKITIE